MRLCSLQYMVCNACWLVQGFRDGYPSGTREARHDIQLLKLSVRIAKVQAHRGLTAQSHCPTKRGQVYLKDILRIPQLAVIGAPNLSLKLL